MEKKIFSKKIYFFKIFFFFSKKFFLPFFGRKILSEVTLYEKGAYLPKELMETPHVSKRPGFVP